MLHPEVPTCDDCETWLYDPKTWKRISRIPGGPWLERPVDKDGRKITPCESCPKILQGEDPCSAVGRKAELSPKNLTAYQHYLECKAVGQFPQDATVKRHAGVIRMVEDFAARQQTKMAAIDSMILVLTAKARA